MSEDQNVLFRCRHEQPDAIIYWLINGTLSNRYSDIRVGSISESDGTLVDTLTIPTIPVYNGTEVVCGATFFDGSPTERTPSVTLTITGWLQHYSTLDTMPVSTVPINKRLKFSFRAIETNTATKRHENDIRKRFLAYARMRMIDRWAPGVTKRALLLYVRTHARKRKHANKTKRHEI